MFNDEPKLPGINIHYFPRLSGEFPSAFFSRMSIALAALPSLLCPLPTISPLSSHPPHTLPADCAMPATRRSDGTGGRLAIFVAVWLVLCGRLLWRLLWRRWRRRRR